MKLTKQIFFSFCLLIFACNLRAQTTATNQTATTVNYISHTVKAGETLTVLAKEYKITVGTIMRFNHMNTQSVLIVGKVIKIPIAKTVVAKPVTTDTAAKNVPGNMIPVTHFVAKGESLSSLAKKYHTTVLQLKSWNKLKSDVIIDGHSLIVGYAGTTNAMQPAATNTQSQPEITAPKQDTPSVQTQPQMTMPVHDTVVPQPAAASVSNEETKTVAAPDASSLTQTQQPAFDMSNIPDIGFFSLSFGLGMQGRSLQTASGTSMTFKTTSGWSDKKYYILINNVPPGSIVRVNSADNKIIYAKVLGTMTGIKENEGLDFRISTAAAAALGLSDAKFPLTVTFYE